MEYGKGMEKKKGVYINDFFRHMPSLNFFGGEGGIFDFDFCRSFICLFVRFFPPSLSPFPLP